MTSKDLDEKLARLERTRTNLLAAMMQAEEVLAAIDKKITGTKLLNGSQAAAAAVEPANGKPEIQ